MRMKKVVMMFGLAALIAWCTPGASQAKKSEEAQPLTVTMSQKSGVYAENFALKLDCGDADAVYYTLDGSDPRTSATRQKYEDSVRITDRSGDANYVTAVDPILYDAANVTWNNSKKEFTGTVKAPADDAVDKGTVVRAVAADASGNYGAVVTNTYFVGTVAEHIEGAKESAEAAGIPLSVMSISVNYEDLFDAKTGIYVKGDIYENALKEYLQSDTMNSWNAVNVSRNLDANYKQRGKDWERAAHVDYFETDGTTLDAKLQQDCGIRIQGNYSRSDLMKGLRLYARAEYGAKNFKYEFFQNAKDQNGDVIGKHKKLVLRNGGNYAFDGTKYNDTYWQSLLDEMDCETQASRACIVYIDGEYWGLYILQQDYDDSYFEQTHGVNKDDVVVYKASDAAADAQYAYKLDEGTLPDGVTNADYYYEELLKFFEEHEDLKADADYEAFSKLVDVQSVMDYFAVNVWVNNKWDWPGKNWSMWKTAATDDSNPYADGRWRFCFYDLDFGGCGGVSEIYTNTIKEDNYNTNGKGLLGQNLKEPMNPALQCFILCMSNEKFRTAYKTELDGLANGAFKQTKAVTRLDKFRETYEPLFQQYYTRYFGKEKAEQWCTSTVSGSAGYNALKEFVTGRVKGIDAIITYIDKYYTEPEETPQPSQTPGASSQPVQTPGASAQPSVSPQPVQTPGASAQPSVSSQPAGTSASAKKIALKVTAVKGRRTIKIKTVSKGKVTITLSKKMMYNGKKTYRKYTWTASGKGVVTVRLSSRLRKGMKLQVKVAKAGYQTTKKNVKVA